MNINNIKNYISEKDITFLIDVDKTIHINKMGKYHYHKIFTLNIEALKDFILTLDNDKIYMIMPFISVNCRIVDPYLTLSRQFLLSNQSNYSIIHDYLWSQFEIALRDFGIDEINNSDFYLILKYKSVTFEKCVFK